MKIKPLSAPLMTAASGIATITLLILPVFTFYPEISGVKFDGFNLAGVQITELNLKEISGFAIAVLICGAITTALGVFSAAIRAAETESSILLDRANATATAVCLIASAAALVHLEVSLNASPFCSIGAAYPAITAANACILTAEITVMNRELKQS